MSAFPKKFPRFFYVLLLDAFKKEGDLGLVAASSKRTQKNLGNFFGKAG